MVTTSAINNHQDAYNRIHQMFGQTPTAAAAPPTAAFGNPADMPPDPPSRQAVLEACSMDALGAVYRRAVDNNGQSQPGRFLACLPRYTIVGGGTHALKRAQDGAVVTELAGVIVRLAPYRVLYGRPVAGDRMAPSCASLDNREGYGQPGGICPACPQTIYQGPGHPWCRSKSRLYIAIRQTKELAVVDLTAMSREGLDALLQWAGQHQADVRDFCVRLTLQDHPRNQGSGNNRTSLLVAQPGAVADDGSPEYRQALEQAAELLTYAEGAWLVDISRSADGSGGRTPARIGGGPPAMMPDNGSDDRRQLAGSPASPAAPPDDYSFEPPPDDWVDVDDLPF